MESPCLLLSWAQRTADGMLSSHDRFSGFSSFDAVRQSPDDPPEAESLCLRTM